MIFHCRFLKTGARHHDVSGTVFSTVSHSLELFSRIAKERESHSKHVPLFTHTARKSWVYFPNNLSSSKALCLIPWCCLCIIWCLSSCTGAHLYNSVFPVLPARVIVKRKLMVWKLKLVFSFWPLNHHRVNGIQTQQDVHHRSEFIVRMS